VISGYLESLAAALSFDRSLAHCVRQEVEDHLRQAVAADPLGNGLEAERRAIAAFGDPQVIAAQFAMVSLAKQTRRVGVATILVIAGVFIAMKARLAWYAAMRCVVGDEIRSVSDMVGLIDRYAFWLAVLIGIAGLAYSGGQRIPAALHPASRTRLRRRFLLCTAATGALVVSVISDGVLTALRLPGTALSAEFLIPILSMALEIACASVLVYYIRRLTPLAAAVSKL
jgi:HAAS domain-containing protein